jgi:hypothetical protein
MKKYLLMLLCCGSLAFAQAQTKKAIHDAATAPDRPAQSAKADLYVQQKTNVVTHSAENKGTQTAVKTRKKKGCSGNGKCCRKA